jgi:glycosyltransferase domain-containing protein
MFNKKLLDWAQQYIGQSPESDKACRDLEDVTIIVPTYKRPDYVIRTIAYWSRQRAHVSVMDGSPEALPEAICETISGRGNLSYCHAPVSFPERIRMAAAKARTKYVMCLADDDFYVPSGLFAAMRMLDANENAVACMGQAVGMDVYNNSSPYLFPYGESLRNYKIDENAVVDRMRRGIRDYRSAAFYAMYRKDSFESIWSDIQRSSCPEQIEYEQAMRAYLNGALLTTSEVYWVRSFECDPVASPIDGARTTNFSSWFSSRSLAEEKNDFVDRLTHALRSRTKLDETEAKALIQELCGHIINGSHVGLSDSPNVIASAFIRVKTFMRQGQAAGLVDRLRYSGLGVRLRTQFLHSSRKKLRESSRNFPESAAEISEILRFVRKFLAARNSAFR